MGDASMHDCRQQKPSNPTPPEATLAGGGETGEITLRTERRTLTEVGGHFFRHERCPDRAARPETAEEVRASLLRMRAHEGMVVRGTRPDAGDMRGDLHLHLITEIAPEVIDISG